MDYSKLTLYLLGAFLILNLIVGLLAGRNVKTMRDYALADKSYRTGPLVMTYLATIVCGGWLFNDSRDIYENGVGMFFVILGGSIAMFIRAKYIAPRMLPFRNCFTLGDIIGTLYGRESKILAGVISVLFVSACAGLQIACFGFVFEKFLGIKASIGIAISALILTLYSSFGGVRSVTATDIFQFVFLVLTLGGIALLAVNKVGGIETLINQVPANKFDILGSKNFYFYLSVILLDLLFSAEMVDSPRLTRMLMAKSPYHFSKMQYIGGVSLVLINILIVLMSLSASVLYPGIESSNVIPQLVGDLVPQGLLQSIAIIGVMAILFSSGDSCVHSAGVAISRDIAKPVGEIFNIKLNELKWARLSTAIVGILSIIFAIYGKSLLSRMDYVLSIVAPILAAPLLLGILGIKPEKQAFWKGAFMAVATFMCCKVFLPAHLQPLSLIIPCVTNAIMYMIVHIDINHGICIESWEGYNSPTAKQWKLGKKDISVKIKDFFMFPFRFASICRNAVNKYGTPPYALFGVLYIFVLVMPYFLWRQEPSPFDNTILYIRMLGVLFCSLLITESIWPEIIRKPYIAAFWYISLTYCLPFVSTMLVLLTNGAMEYTVSMAITLMLLIILTRWASAIAMAIIGVGAAICCSKYCMLASHDMAIPPFSFHSRYMLSYQVALAIVIGLLFIRQKHKVVDLNRIMSTKLDNLNKWKNEILKKAFLMDKLRADSLGMKEINMIERVENLKTLCNSLISSVPNRKDFEQNYSEGVQTLEYIESVAESSRKYLKLDVGTIKLDLIFGAISESASVYSNSHSIVVRTELEELETDHLALLNGVIFEALEKVEFYKAESDHVTIDVSDTKIMYKLPSLLNYDKVVDALQFTISKAPSLGKEFFPEFYKIEAKNPKDIPCIEKETTEAILSERIIAAHFGELRYINNEDGCTAIVVVPKKLRDVRPLPFDLDTPAKDITITWPGALELENQLKEQIKLKAPNIDLKHIDTALSIIKRYHFHQTRKSGEPYYLHPVQVAMIELEFSQEEEAILGALLHDTIEDTALTMFDLKTIFSDRVANIVFGVSKVDYGGMPIFHSNEEHLKTLERSNDFSILSIKISDRIHNMRTISGHRSRDKRREVAKETLEFFVPLAKRLGLEKAYADLKEMAERELKRQ